MADLSFLDRILSEHTSSSPELSQNELLRLTADSICEHFGIYFVAVYLVDSTSEWAIFKAGSGEYGRRIGERGHQIRVDGRLNGNWPVATALQYEEILLVGWRTRQVCRYASSLTDHSELTITFDGVMDCQPDGGPYFAGQMLPDSEWELYMPMWTANGVIGALEVHTEKIEGFDLGELKDFRSIADKVAKALSVV